MSGSTANNLLMELVCGARQRVAIAFVVRSATFFDIFFQAVVQVFVIAAFGNLGLIVELDIVHEEAGEALRLAMNFAVCPGGRFCCGNCGWPSPGGCGGHGGGRRGFGSMLRFSSVDRSVGGKGIVSRGRRRKMRSFGLGGLLFVGLLALRNYFGPGTGGAGPYVERSVVEGAAGGSRARLDPGRDVV